MREKLNPRTKYFFKNLLQCLIIAGVCIIIFGFIESGESGRIEGSLLNGLLATGIMAIIILSIKLALDSTNTAFPSKGKDSKKEGN